MIWSIFLIWNLPNIITFFRIALIPFFVLFFYIPIPGHHLITAALFALAGFTDWLDGFIARRFQQTSKLGAFLDPVADKLMVAVALVVIVNVYPFWWVAIPAAIIISREIVVSALREWMAEIGQRAVVKVSMVGKLKTVCQMCSMVVLLIKPTDLSNPWVIASFILLYVAVLLTVYSMWLYLVAAHHSFKEVAQD